MSLHGEYDPNNIFARILRDELPSVRVFEDEHAVALMDVFPQSPGHVLIIPRQSRARNILEIEPQALAHLIEVSRRVAIGVNAALSPEGISVFQYNGDAGGQTIFHLHFHVVPRWADRPLKGHGHAPMADAEELRALADKIAAHMPAG